MTGDDVGRADAIPARDLDRFLAPSTSASVPRAFDWDGQVWLGPHVDVSYPVAGHDVLPAEPDNWWYAHRAATVVEALGRARAPRRVLWDIGGGTGLMAPAFRRAGWDTVLVEPVAGAARRAAGRADLIIAGTLEDLELPDGSLPAIGLFDVIEHLGDSVGMLRECRRTLTKGGVIAITVPAHQWLWSATDDAAGHKRRYDRATMQREAREAGLRVIEQRHFFTSLVPGVAAARLVRERLHRAPESEAAVLERERRMLNPGAITARCLSGLLAAERALTRRFPAPVGLSLFALLGRDDEGAGRG